MVRLGEEGVQGLPRRLSAGGTSQKGRGEGCQRRCSGALRAQLGFSGHLEPQRPRTPPLKRGKVAASPVGSLGGAPPKSSSPPQESGKANPTQATGHTFWRREMLGESPGGKGPSVLLERILALDCLWGTVW